MEKLIELAQKIEDKDLRNKVLELLKNPTLTHKDFKKYEAADIKKVKTPFSVGSIGSTERDVLNHVVAVTELCMDTAKVVEKNYGLKVNKDYLLAGALLHDIGKLFEWKMEGGSSEHTGILLDHTFIGVAELYARGFPEQVIHIVASHFGEAGPTPPRNFEALILHHVDSMLSLTEFYNNIYKDKSEMRMPLIVLDEETIKKLSGKEEK